MTARPTCPFAHLASTAKAEPAVPLATLLRTGTQDLHELAEHHAFQKNMLDGKVERSQYALYLVQVLYVHATLDPALRDLSRAEPRFAPLIQPSHFRYEIIRQDLEDLGVRHETCVVHASTRRFVKHIEAATKSDPAALLGALYVHEGATNGNKVVLKAIRRGLALPEGVATRYLDPHGTEQRPRWTAFKSEMDALDLTEAERNAMLAGARQAFQFFIDLSDDVAALTPNPEVQTIHLATPVWRS